MKKLILVVMVSALLIALAGCQDKGARQAISQLDQKVEKQGKDLKAEIQALNAQIGEISCTTERAKELNPTRWAKIESENREEKEQANKEMAALEAIKAKVKSLPAPPAGTPVLPQAFLGEIWYSQRLPVPSYENNECLLSTKYDSVTERVPFNGTWQELLATAGYRWANFAKEHGDLLGVEAKERDHEIAYFLVNNALPVLPYDYRSSSWLKIAKVILGVFNRDSYLVQRLGEWMINNGTPLIQPETRPLAGAVITDLYNVATKTDFSTLHTEVTNEEDEKDLSAEGLRLTGLIYRRWAENGGDNLLILRLRFWLTKAAQALGMPEAKTMAAEVKTAMEAADPILFDKRWYVSQLNAI